MIPFCLFSVSPDFLSLSPQQNYFRNFFQNRFRSIRIFDLIHLRINDETWKTHSHITHFLHHPHSIPFIHFIQVVAWYLSIAIPVFTTNSRSRNWSAKHIPFCAENMLKWTVKVFCRLLVLVGRSIESTQKLELDMQYVNWSIENIPHSFPNFLDTDEQMISVKCYLALTRRDSTVAFG